MDLCDLGTDIPAASGTEQLHKQKQEHTENKLSKPLQRCVFRNFAHCHIMNVIDHHEYRNSHSQ